jgi:type I restriction enzyme S subunit
MAGDWRSSTWGEEISLEYGKALRRHDEAQGRYRVFGANGPIGWTSQPLAQGPGVILGRKGAYRGVQYSPGPFFVIDTAYYVVPKSELDMRWLYYAIKHYKLGEVDDGSPIPSTTRAAVYMLDLDIPLLDEQRAIAHILGTLDDKIELNRWMNETLEAMAQALFKSWVMDFGPVRVKADDLVRDRILEIGDGYRAKNSEFGETGLPFIRAGNLNDGFDTAGADLLREESVAKAGSKVSRVGDVAFTSKGTIGRFARVAQHTEQFVYSPQVCYWRSLDPARLHPVILYCWMQSDDLKAQIAAVAGQTDMAPYVSLQDQRQMSIPIFPPSQDAVASQIEPLLARQSSNVVETKTLGALRNALLPKLISGELRVKDPGRIVGLPI